MARVYALDHVPPEVGAYGMAKYSRSADPLQASLVALSQQQAAKFLETFYFDYGHASIADLAHVALAIEEVSLIAAMEVVDEPLWDGQERSTRYQNFDGAPYYTPRSAGPAFGQLVDRLFEGYRAMKKTAGDALSARYPRPDGMSPARYRRTIDARTFDLARYYLPLATLTSLGQITSARVLEGQIRRLLASPLEEARTLAESIREAVQESPPFDLLVAQGRLASAEARPLLPTLTRYLTADAYRQTLRARIRIPAREVLAPFADRPLPADAVTLHGAHPDPVTDRVSILLYQASDRSLAEVRSAVEALPAARRQEILDLALADRGRHDPWPDAFRSAPLQFDVVMDTGAFRDFNRHRRLFKTVQDLVPRMGFAVPAAFADLSLDRQLGADLAAHYRQLQDLSGEEALYGLPLAHRRRALFSMDYAEAAYLIELRSQSQGHFSYRETAWAMFQALSRDLPAFARHIRVEPLDAFDPLAR